MAVLTPLINTSPHFRWLSEKEPTSPTLSSWPKRLLHVGRMSRAIIGVAVAAILFLLLFSQHPSASTLRLAKPEIDGSKARGFHLLVPASKPEGNLCKNVLSSTILRYPTPNIINWGKTFDNDTLANGGSHLGKIAGVLDYLKTLDVAQDEDLVLLVDGYDIWFQLPPQLLVSRYNAIIAKAEERVRNDFGKKAFKDSKIRQSIVFSSQKKCWPGDWSDVHCYAVPPAQLPSDIYGPDTDVDIRPGGDDTYIWARYRQRYLNSGVMMGPAADVRAMFTRALEHVEEDPGRGSDQAIFAKIFGTQEYARMLMKENLQASHQIMATTSSPSAFWSWPSSLSKPANANAKPPSILDPHPTHKKLELEIGKNYEFSINLDYESVLGQPTVFADFDLDWITYNDAESLTSARAERNVSHTLPGSNNLDADITRTPGPFVPFSNTSTTSSSSRLLSTTSLSLPADGSLSSPNTSWSDVPLFNNLWTGITPAIVHHNAHRDGLKSNREKMWDRIWFQPHARQLLTQRLKEDRTGLPVAEAEGVRWLDAVESRNKPGRFVFRTDRKDEEWVTWDRICDQGMQEEVFRDEKGLFEGLENDRRSRGEDQDNNRVKEEEEHQQKGRVKRRRKADRSGRIR